MKKSHICHILFPAVVEVMLTDLRKNSLCILCSVFSHFTGMVLFSSNVQNRATVNIRGAHYDCSLKHRAEGSHLNLSFHLQRFETVLSVTFANLTVSKGRWQQNLKQIFSAGCFQKYDYSLLTLKFWPTIVWNYVLPPLWTKCFGLNVSRFIASIFSKTNNVVDPHFVLTFRHKESTVNRLQLQIRWPCPKRDRDWSIPTLRRWPLTWVTWAPALQGCVLYIWMSGACTLPKN